jgi:hypothetical protein
MSSGDNQGHDRDVREKIVSLMQTIGQAPTKPLASDELQKLKTAANRLDQLLKSASNADQQALKGAIGRLDQLLADIGAGKDIAIGLKRRRERPRQQENPS